MTATQRLATACLAILLGSAGFAEQPAAGNAVTPGDLVVDTGIHAKRWTREQGVRFFVDVNGSNPLEVASEVDRYCSWPGQACGYKVGHSEINRQRDKAKAALGQKYDLKAFDDAVVLGGNVPLDVLAKNVDEHIRTAKA